MSELGELAWKGERVIMAKAGKPYLDLRPYRETRVVRSPGRFAGQIDVSPDFNATSDAVIESFEGKG